MKHIYRIFTDASADLIPEFAEKENIGVIPMLYTLGDEEFTCAGTEPTEVMRNYYNGEREGKMTHTSQISPQTYLERFRDLAQNGESILYISLSGGLSSTYQSSVIAAEELTEEFPDIKIRCIDSLSASVGIQLLLELAAENRASGMDIDENADWLEKNRLSVCHWFMVEDLMYLKRGGRISPAVAAVGTALNIKPILRIESDGKLINFAKRRGTKSALDQLVKFYDEASEKPEGERICIVHADNEKYADYLEQELKKINPGCSISKNMLSPVIGCHTGPGMCAIVHFGKRI